MTCYHDTNIPDEGHPYICADSVHKKPALISLNATMPHLINHLLLHLSHRILRQPGRPFLLDLIIAFFPVLPVIPPPCALHPPALPSRPNLITIITIITLDIDVIGFANELGVWMLILFGRSVSCDAIFTCIVGGGIFSDSFVAFAVGIRSCR